MDSDSSTNTTAKLPSTSGVCSALEISSPESPAAMIGITRHADGLLSARMHAAILGLLNACPASLIAYQGKARGLLRNFGIERLCLDLEGDVGSKIDDAVRWMLAERMALRRQIAGRLSTVRRLAALNFDGLD